MLLEYHIRVASRSRRYKQPWIASRKYGAVALSAELTGPETCSRRGRKQDFCRTMLSFSDAPFAAMPIPLG